MIGNTIYIYADGALIAACKSCSLTYSADTIEVSSPTDGGCRHFITDRKSWEATCKYLVTSPQNIGQRMLMVGNTYTVKFGNQNDYVSGSAILIQCDTEASVGALVSGSFKFKGSGPLE